ncbi:hypothetical protein M422DRAFT_268813 [Sphaerobolus stellatus SS14]|uniref:Uncharacterized protein n=1 Tax=Sphaerobolus stellatus (strain SS14) TaxID=990650 RepID=A0A0C9UWY3_SPHS4|nr:hypothetical protein M422DRAFT_268813 [Sphaerobolus stellatus SS14]
MTGPIAPVEQSGLEIDENQICHKELTEAFTNFAMKAFKVTPACEVEIFDDQVNLFNFPCAQGCKDGGSLEDDQGPYGTDFHCDGEDDSKTYGLASVVSDIPNTYGLGYFDMWVQAFTRSFSREYVSSSLDWPTMVELLPNPLQKKLMAGLLAVFSLLILQRECGEELLPLPL